MGNLAFNSKLLNNAAQAGEGAREFDIFRKAEVKFSRQPILYPEPSGSLASGWLPGETLGYRNFITTGFLR